jgi:hypothetical protein
MCTQWTTYRTRFLIRAMQLEEPLTVVDCIGREHSGKKGDYLVLSSDGSRRIAPREIFEDIYVPMDQPAEPWPLEDELAGQLTRDHRKASAAGRGAMQLRSRAQLSQPRARL